MVPVLLLAGFVAVSVVASEARPPVPILLDTDMESDVDDVGGLAMLHALADRGEAEILGVMVGAKNPHSAACADRINTYFGRSELPVGNLQGPGVDRNSRYARQIAEEFPGDLARGDQAPDAVSLYRRILAEQPDQHVVILSIGYLTNLRDLLQSEPDAHSELDGRALIERKVRLWVCMGGQFPEGLEANLRWDATASVEVLADWPTEIIFSGWEIGTPVMTGRHLARLPDSSPVRRAYQLFNNLHPHHSWDQVATLYAVRGIDGGPAADYWTLSPRGRLIVDPNDGRNRWQDDPEGNHRYKRAKRAPEQIAEEIDVLMMHQPAGRGGTGRKHAQQDSNLRPAD